MRLQGRNFQTGAEDTHEASNCPLSFRISIPLDAHDRAMTAHHSSAPHDPSDWWAAFPSEAKGGSARAPGSYVGPGTLAGSPPSLTPRKFMSPSGGPAQREAALQPFLGKSVLDFHVRFTTWREPIHLATWEIG